MKKTGKSGWDNYVKLEKGLSIGTRQDQSSGIYYCRLRIDGRNRDYSLGTRDKTEAIVLAAKKKGLVSGKGIEAVQRKKKSGKRKVWLDVKWEEFLEYKKNKVRNGVIKESRLGVYRSIDRNWFGKYIRKKPARIDFEKLDDDYFSRFWDWRISYYGSVEHKRDDRIAREDGYIRSIRKPNGHGLDNERKIIKEFLTWSFRKGFTDKGVPMSLDQRQMGINRSAEGFNYEEYTKLQKVFSDWIADAKNENEELTRQRILFKFKLMLACGTRVADLVQLQWKDLRSERNPQTKKTETYFFAKAKGKRRLVPISEDLNADFEIWKKKSKFTEPDDYVFATETGKKSNTDNTQWKSFLKLNGCLKDPNGKTRNMTSLRHTFASFAILYSDEKTSVIADRMGTSERQIETTYKDDLARRDSARYTKHLVPMMDEHDNIRYYLDNMVSFQSE